MKLVRSSVVVALIGLLWGLPALAQATPPDSAWISGFYDEEDHDLVIIRIIATIASVEPFPLGVSLFVQSVVTGPFPTRERPRSSIALAVSHARAPPALCARRSA